MRCLQTIAIVRSVAYKRIKTEHVVVLDEARRGRERSCAVPIRAVTAKEKLVQQAPQWNDAQATAALHVVEAHDELASYLDKKAPSADEHDDRWATANAREAIREERW
jgi:hypothetical protein